MEEQAGDPLEAFLLSSIIPQEIDSFPAEIVRKKEYGSEDVRLAMKSEIDLKPNETGD